MKGAGKVIFGISIVAALLLVYVHEHFLLFKISYSIGKKSHLLAERAETYRRIKFEVDQLTAPRLLEEQMTKMSLGLTLPKEIHVLKIPATKPMAVLDVTEANIHPVSSHFINLLSRWIDVAQAKTDD